MVQACSVPRFTCYSNTKLTLFPLLPTYATLPPYQHLPRNQTRRTATRRADENAPPAATKTRASRLATAKPTLSTTSSSSSIPTLKRAESSTAAPYKPTHESKKRSALGEVTNAPKVDQAKGKADKEERPITRRTRSTVTEKVVAPKRKLIPPPSRPASSRSTTHDEGILKGREQNIPEGHVQPIEPEPARKKRKTSSPALEEDEDLADPAVYDDDGQEVILSSGRKGTYLQSPKRAAKDEGWTDLDAEDEGDPAMVAEYVIDAFKYMLAIEVGPSIVLWL